MKEIVCRIIYGKSIKGASLPDPKPFPQRDIECISFNKWAMEYGVSAKYNKYESAETIQRLRPIKFTLTKY